MSKSNRIRFCVVCGEQIQVGDDIEHTPEIRSYGGQGFAPAMAMHLACKKNYIPGSAPIWTRR